jgi:hypothetical protein
MPYVMCRSHRMQKQKFNTMCPNTIFVASVPVPPEHEKYLTKADRVAPRMHRNALCDPHIPPDAKKHKFGITHPEALFVKSVLVPPEHEK